MKDNTLTQEVSFSAQKSLKKLENKEGFKEAAALVEKSKAVELDEQTRGIYHLNDSMLEAFNLSAKLQIPPVRSKRVAFITVPLLEKLRTILKNIFFPALTAQEEFNRNVYDSLTKLIEKMEEENENHSAD